MTREAIFSERRALRVRVVRPGANRGIPFPPDGFTMSRWPRGPMPRSSRCLPLRACGARPSAGGEPRVTWPCGGRPGDDARGDFLGGTRSARPRGKAGRKPSHVMIAGGWAKRPVAKRTRVRVGVMRSLRACGARPSAKGQSRAGMPFRGNPEMARKTVFSEGRTPCVRMVKPHECRSIPFQPDAWANGRRPSGDMFR